MSNPSQPLPAEIVDAIIDLLHDDWQALATCASMSSAWRSRALVHLSKSVTIVSRRPPFAEALRFMRVFRPGSVLADALTTLVVRGRGRSADLPYMLDLAHFRNLRSLSLVGLTVRTINKLRDFLASCPQSIEELCFDRLSLVNIPLAVGGGDGSRALLQGIRPFPRLRALRLRLWDDDYGCHAVHYALYESLIVGAWSSVLLRTLSVHTFGREWNLPTGASLVGRMQGTLQDVRVTPWRPVDPDDALMSALSRCASLQKLTLCFVPVDDAHRARYPHILESLATWLTPPRCHFAASLRELTLMLHYPMEPMIPHARVAQTEGSLLAAFADVLLPRTYPHLSKLRILLYSDAPDLRLVFGRAALQNPGTAVAVEAPLWEEHVERVMSALRPLEDGGVRVEVCHASSFMTFLDAIL
ncbi:hypothetical protein OH77DRAFT_1001940 [Trametes cingulata]|nr:hypothetical protein OH77DRAFT_1001940 [Trametes cingulata]